MQKAVTCITTYEAVIQTLHSEEFLSHSLSLSLWGRWFELQRASLTITLLNISIFQVLDTNFDRKLPYQKMQHLQNTSPVSSSAICFYLFFQSWKSPSLTTVLDQEAPGVLILMERDALKITDEYNWNRWSYGGECHTLFTVQVKREYECNCTCPQFSLPSCTQKI